MLQALTAPYEPRGPEPEAGLTQPGVVVRPLCHVGAVAALMYLLNPLCGCGILLLPLVGWTFSPSVVAGAPRTQSG